MATTLKAMLQSLPADQVQQIQKRANELKAEEMSLKDLRRARSLTQEQIAKHLKIQQDGVSRIEKRADLLLSTLSSYIKSMGGELNLIVEFPDRPPVKLSGIAAIEQFDEKTQ